MQTKAVLQPDLSDKGLAKSSTRVSHLGFGDTSGWDDSSNRERVTIFFEKPGFLENFVRGDHPQVSGPSRIIQPHASGAQPVDHCLSKAAAKGKRAGFLAGTGEPSRDGPLTSSMPNSRPALRGETGRPCRANYCLCLLLSAVVTSKWVPVDASCQMPACGCIKTLALSLGVHMCKGSMINVPM
ncbi:hypothetical protein CYMTET_10135 [Cymbomonas tetramitiformis]|uniref:Uncharacterized protein n=1 Tax=Cymbomonas tetramitiformis TaxID=36881 RepID=A0AAE0GPR8_9CHLO|nr:hypothetical protein CYMTET_10135 [Cymbomonas tetramitiformis]